MGAKRELSLKIRKTHRYLGLFIGLQFLAWTVSGLYFSWTDIDEIHGDQFKRKSARVGAENQAPGRTQSDSWKQRHYTSFQPNGS